jgi:glycosyltransferase involved in cell wall biosynthesis
MIDMVKPDVLFCYMAKPNVYGGPAGRKAGVRRIVLMIEGLGNVFVPSKDIKRKLLRGLLVALYRRAGKRCDRMIFLNHDDRKEFIEMGIVPQEKAEVIDGIGVNMQHFTPAPLPEKPAFLLITRLLREKGVLLYLEAAAMIKRYKPDVRIMLVGPYENNAFAITEEDIRPYIKNGVVEYFGEQKDVRPFLAQASAFVLPTSYREGLPRTILEAMACQRAVITTDMPGCRGTVIPCKTGLIIKPGDVTELVQAMKRLVDNPEEARRMGMEGYARCAEEYEVTKVNAQMIELLGL